MVKNNLIKGSFSQFYACHYKVTAPAYLNVEMRKIKSLSKHPNNKQTFRQGKKENFQYSQDQRPSYLVTGKPVCFNLHLQKKIHLRIPPSARKSGLNAAEAINTVHMKSSLDPSHRDPVMNRNQAAVWLSWYTSY